MIDHDFVFLAGLHRSGTSILHELLRAHPEISGFEGTGVPEDEGQHLQTVFRPAYEYGGPGKFVFDERSLMDETHELVSEDNARAIFDSWAPHYDVSKRYLIEKSPPNLVRARFLQALFPNSRFVVILRHPVAVSYATQKWSRTSIRSLLEHTLRAYEIFVRDAEKLNSVMTIRYEDFVAAPQPTLDLIFGFLGLPSAPCTKEVRSTINAKYFDAWRAERANPVKRLLMGGLDGFEARANAFGYSLRDLDARSSVDWIAQAA